MTRRVRYDRSLVFAHAWIFWEAEDMWYLGRVCEYSAELDAHRVHYFVDNHVEWRRLSEFGLRVKHTATEAVLLAEAWRRIPANVPAAERISLDPDSSPPPPLTGEQRAALLRLMQAVPRVTTQRMALMAEESGVQRMRIRRWINGLRAWNSACRVEYKALLAREAERKLQREAAAKAAAKVAAKAKARAALIAERKRRRSAVRLAKVAAKNVANNATKGLAAGGRKGSNGGCSAIAAQPASPGGYTVHRLSGKRRRRAFERHVLDGGPKATGRHPALQRATSDGEECVGSSASVPAPAPMDSGSANEGLASLLAELGRQPKRSAAAAASSVGCKRTALLRSTSEGALTSAVIRRLGRKGGSVLVGEIIFGDLECRRCGRGDDECNILICERCDSGFHLYCLRPVLPAVPPGRWFCDKCDTHTREERFNFELFKRRWLVARPREVFRFFGLDVKSLAARPTPAPDALAKLERSRLCFRLPRPSLDVTRRLLQYASLASAMESKKMRFKLNLWYEGERAHRNRAEVSFLLFTVTFYANRAHNLTRSP